MFKNVGKKIKGLAKFVCWLGILASVAVGAMCIVAGYVTVNGASLPGLIVGPVIIVVGAIGSWISSWTLYAFGQITDDVQAIRESVDK